MNHRSNVSVYVSVYIHAQAFSASLKRSLNLSANKYYYYYGERLDCLKAVLVLNVAQQKSPSPERGGDGASQFSTENDLPRLSGY